MEHSDRIEAVSASTVSHNRDWYGRFRVKYHHVCEEHDVHATRYFWRLKRAFKWHDDQFERYGECLETERKT